MSAEGVASESQEEQIWLWQEGGRVAWWSPSARGDLDRARPGRLDLCNLSELRSGFGQAEIGTELGRESGLAKAVCGALDKRHTVRLRLLRDLSDEDQGNDWTRVPFEWMRWNGAPLHGRLMVERYVPREAVEPLEPRPLLRGVKVFKRLSPQDDAEFAEAFSPGGRLPRIDEIDVLDEAGSAEEFGEAALDLDRLAALVLVCHGTEAVGDSPFRLPDGSSWALPRDRGMPPLVVLLVCGSDAGNLLGYARDALLLSQSTQTVIAAAGKLGLSAAGQFLRRFLEEWADGRAVSEIVRDSQAAVARDPDGLDARRLCVMGRGDLRLDAPWGASLARSWLEMPDAELVTRVRNDTDEDAAALTTLVNRCTLRCLLEGTLGYEDELRRRLQMSRESVTRLLDRCLRNAGSQASGPVQLWGLSRGWALRACGQLDQARYKEFEPYRQDLMPFPAQGDPGRDTPGFEVEDLPSPIAMAWQQVNDALDQQRLPQGLQKLKEAFEVAVRFVASVAVMDLLRAAGGDREHKPDQERLIKRLFGPEPPRTPGDWVKCLRVALRAQGVPRQVDGLRDLASEKPQPKFLNLLTGGYVAWQEEGDYDMRRSTAELVPQILIWLERLRALLEEVSKAWSDWTFKDSRAGARWHGSFPSTRAEGHEYRVEGGGTSLVMVHEDGRTLDLSPLLTVQCCDQCEGERVFFYTERRAGTAGAGAEFRDYPNDHDKRRSHVQALAALGLGNPAAADTRLGDVAARAQEEELAFRDFANAEKPGYLYDLLSHACDDLAKMQGCGYVHMLGPEGFGKSWFVRRLADDARREVQMHGQCVLLCRIAALGPNAAADFIDHLCVQARDQRLTGVDEARKRALEDMHGASAQFATLVGELVDLNDLDRLTVAIDGLDELSEPVKRPSRQIMRRHKSGPQVVREQAYGSLGEDVVADMSVIEFEERTALDESVTLEIDEVVEAVVNESDERFLLDFLPPVDRLPSRVFVLLTSREVLGGRATERLAQLRTADGWIEIHLKPGSQDNIEVVRRYIGRHVKRRELAVSIMQRSGGVFLWAYHLVQAIVQGAFLEQDVLPEGGEFYSAYLDKLRRREGEVLFESVYLRLLLLLAAAQEPVTDAQLARWGLGEGRLRSALGLLWDFLSVRHAPRRYSIKHDGLQRHFSANPQMAAQLQEAHTAIAELTIARFAGGWGELDLANVEDQYTIRHLPAHVRAASKVRNLDDAEIEGYVERLKSLANMAAASRNERSVADRVMLSDALHAWADALTIIRRYGQAVVVFGEAIALRRTLVAEGQQSVRAPLAASFHRQGVALGGQNLHEEALFAHTEATALWHRLVAEGTLAVRSDLARALFFKSNELGRLNRRDEEIVALGSAISVVRELVAEGKKAERQLLAQLLSLLGLLTPRIDRQGEKLAAFGESASLRREMVVEGQKAERGGLADALDNQGQQLYELKRHSDAVAARSEAIAFRRELVAEGQQTARAPLAASLYGQGLAMAKLKRHDDALEAYGEAIAIRRELVAEGQHAARRGLAESLFDQGTTLGDLKRYEEAATAYGESASVRRELVKEGQVAERFLLASALVLQGVQLDRLERCEEAVAAFSEAVLVRRGLVAESQKASRNQLAADLRELGRLLNRLKRHDEALRVLVEARTIRRELLAEGQTAERNGLALSLSDEGFALTGLQRRDEAVAAFAEVASIRRELVTEGQHVLRAGLCEVLGYLGEQLRALKRHDEAAAAYAEAAADRRERLAQGQQTVRSPLASSLYNQGLALAELKRHQDAAASFGEAVAIRRELVAEGQQAERSSLCDALSFLGEQLRALKRNEEAAAAFGEAASDRRERAAQGELAVRDFLARSLYSQGVALAALKRYGGALVAHGEAASVRRALVTEGQQEAREPLASSLHAQGFALDEVGRREDAVRLYDEAIALRRELLADGQLSTRGSLAWVLNNKGWTLRELGRVEEAIHACDESIALRRKLLSEGQLSVRRGLENAVGNRGAALTELGRNTEALAAFEEAIAMARNSISDGVSEAKSDLVWLLRLRGKALLSGGRSADGLASIRQAIEAARGFISAGFKEAREPLADALTDHGEVLLDEADIEGARVSLEEAIAILEELSAEDPRWEPKKELAKALTGYARALDHLGRTEDAQAARDRAAALKQQKPH